MAEVCCGCSQGMGGEGSLISCHPPTIGKTKIRSVGRANYYVSDAPEKQKLLLAVNAVAGGHMTGRQAAKTFSVPRTTLRRWITSDRRLFPCPHCPHHATERSHLKKHIASRHRDTEPMVSPVRHFLELRESPDSSKLSKMAKE